MNPEEKAKEIINLYHNQHVVITKNSKGKLTPPYKSGFVANSVVNNQSKRFALIHVNGIIENVGMFDVTSVNDYLDYWEKVKQTIESK